VKEVTKKDPEEGSEEGPEEGPEEGLEEGPEDGYEDTESLFLGAISWLDRYWKKRDP
ncbi:hypothetical protein THAOC_28841, partial [Thalassiosira oceanica]